MNSHFCNVALPVPLRTLFTYSVPPTLDRLVQPGARVLVPFRNKSLVGVIVERVDEPPAETKIREITKLVDTLPALTQRLSELDQWMAGYYLSRIGEGLSAIPPSDPDGRSTCKIRTTVSRQRGAQQV